MAVPRQGGNRRTRCLLAAILLITGLLLAGAASAQAAPRTLDDRLADVAKRAPSFGGMYVDEARDVLIARVTDRSDNGRVRRAIRAEFGGLRGWKIRFERARYGMLALADWRERMTDVGSIEGVVFTDLNEARNRLQVGISDPDARAEVEARLAERGIPREAVLITASEPIEPLLRGRHRPYVGGLQINFSGFLCTLGFTARHADLALPGFVTNSHCSEVNGGVTNTPYHQPVQSGTANLIGTERIDPRLFTNAEDPNCPPGRQCRYSDALWAQKAAGVSSTRFLARVSLGFNPATDQWNGTDGWRVMSRGSVLPTGMTVTKTGRTTGRTRGQLTNTCVTAGVLDSDITRLCENLVQGPGTIIASGDSGSPAFLIRNNPEMFDVRLVGIMWGGGGSLAVYSPLNHIRRELGDIKVCVNGFNC